MAIEWTEDIWRGLVESAPDALVMVDREGSIVYASAQTRQLFGYDREEILNKKIECLLPERYRARHVGQRSDYFSNLRVRPMGAGIDLFGLHKDGREIPIEISLSPLQTPQGFMVTAAIRDISDRKRIQEELRKAREVAEAANRSKSEFLANMSHEIRTPLAGILGYAEMIAFYCQTSDERKNYMERIRRCSDTLTELISDILDLSKVEAGALRVEKVSFGLVPEIDGVLGLFESRATEKNVTLDVRYQLPLPTEIISDPTRLRQILSNLVGNAIKFTDQGSVSVHVFTDKSRPGRILFSVTDTGCGLSPEQQSRLFRPFMQADSSTTRKYGGTGLGLMLSRRLAEAMGGELILVRSEPGRGSTFQLSLPIVSGPAPATRPNSDSSRTLSPERPRIDGLRILLAEDNLDNQELIRRFLSEQGANVSLATNGVEALAKCQAQSFDVILMDIQMPELDGYATTRLLRERGIRTPIVAITAHAMNDERDKCLKAGCNEFLTKPLDIGRLLNTVKTLAAAFCP